jgi:Protein of unknown function (DUF3325)
VIFFLLIWSLSSLAFIALASAMSKHQKQFYGHELSPKQTQLASITGWALLLISLIICVMSGQLSSMLSIWVGVLTFSALFVGVLLSYYSLKMKLAASFCVGISLITSVMLLI